MDYAPPPPPREPFAAPFAQALLLGTAVSAVLWFLGWQALDNPFGILMILIVPAAKLIGGILLIVRKKNTGFGAGLLVSIPIGAMIFLGSCFAHVTFH